MRLPFFVLNIKQNRVSCTVPGELVKLIILQAVLMFFTIRYVGPLHHRNSSHVQIIIHAIFFPCQNTSRNSLAKVIIYAVSLPLPPSPPLNSHVSSASVNIFRKIYTLHLKFCLVHHEKKFFLQQQRHFKSRHFTK